MTRKERVTVGHICLEVASLEKSLAFYAPFFRSVGFRKVWSEEGMAGYYAVSFCDADNNVIEVYTVPRAG